MGLAERADVIVDFSACRRARVVRMINTGPDAPFGGFPVAPIADPSTTGQVMEFVVNAALDGRVRRTRRRLHRTARRTWC